MSNPPEPHDEPPTDLDDPAELLREYLNFYRDTVLRKLDGLGDEELRGTRLPSRWNPLGMLKHLVYMERRWLRWGFAGESVEEPWGDRLPEDDGWRLRSDDTLDELRTRLMRQRDRTNAIVSGARLSDAARQGGRFTTTEDCPTLAWILFHVLQEYARHAGHLDIARELIDGTTGE